ncbi:MAG TPA: hypothetical protein VK361_07985, partial [Rubrobacteraceae bacterium]|nr:hypothetical protein [Rubrobacteraceae bacterium]
MSLCAAFQDGDRAFGPLGNLLAQVLAELVRGLVAFLFSDPLRICDVPTKRQNGEDRTKPRATP